MHGQNAAAFEDEMSKPEMSVVARGEAKTMIALEARTKRMSKNCILCSGELWESFRQICQALRKQGNGEGIETIYPTHIYFMYHEP